jgi:hypothetical protein
MRPSPDLAAPGDPDPSRELRSGLSRAPASLLAVALLAIVPHTVRAQTPSQTHTPPVLVAAPDAATLRLILPGQQPQTFNDADLKAMPQKSVTFHNVHTQADEVYTGVPLTSLLVKYGAPAGDKLHGKPLSDYIVAAGSDGYKAVLSLAETDPAFHPGEVLVADTMNGKPIGEKDGPFRLVVTEDKRPARCVHNLVSIELRTAD